MVGCGCLQWGEVVYGRECGCLSLVGRSCLRLVEVVCSGEWFSPPLLPSTAASTTASLSTAALSPCCPIHRNLISRSRGPINCRLIQRFRTGQMSNFPRMCEAGGMKVHQPELGSNLSRWIKIVRDLDLDSDQRTTVQWHSIMMRRHAYSLLAEILKMGIFGILYHHTFIYIHIRAYTCIYVHIQAFHT